MQWGSVTRTSFLVTAVLVGLRGIPRGFDPHYWDPQSLVDYLAVAGTSAMFLALSVAFALLAVGARRTGSRVAAVALAVAAMPSASRGISNGLEEAVRWPEFSYGYVYSGLPFVVSVAIAGVPLLIKGMSWMLGLCLILLALATAFIEPTAYVALPLCCLAAAFLSMRLPNGARDQPVRARGE
jgi:hypothetical protein